MIIDVRPTPALRRHRARIVGVIAGVALSAATLVPVAELATASQPGPQGIHLSDPAGR
jgi:hypothetical protein